MNISLTENNNTIFQMSENEPSSEDECKTGCIMLYIMLSVPFFNSFCTCFCYLAIILGFEVLVPVIAS